jgi:phosphoglycolate phosphatase
MQAAADICGLEGRESGAIRHFIGLGLPEAIQALYPDIEPLIVEQMRDIYSSCYRDAGVEPAAFFRAY